MSFPHNTPERLPLRTHMTNNSSTMQQFSKAEVPKMWSLYQQHRHPWELVRNVLFQAYTGILNQQLWGQSPATHVLKNPSSDSYWIWFGKNAAATEENEVWKKFIILTGPRESVTTWYAGPQGTTLSGKKAEDRMSGSLGQNLY